MMKRTAKVINIINDTTIIIDFGILDSAEVGQKVRIIDKGESVYNLNNEEIGTLDLIKSELEIVEVYDRFSLCQKVTRRAHTIFAMSQIDLSKTVKSVQTLNINSDDVSGLKFPDITPIQKGDIAEIFIY